MNHSEIFRLVNRTCIALWIAFLAVTGAAAEMRGIWVDAFGPGFKTKEEVKQLVADCREYNFNAVFVQMRKRGDAYYFPKAPNTDPRATDIAADYDALAEIIKECHNGQPRIEVHCWAVAYFVWAFDKPPPRQDHVFNKRHDLLSRDSLGQTIVGNGYYLDPGHPEVSKILTYMAKDVVSRYDVDGFHWDYLRYPDRDSGYNPIALQRFKSETGTTDDPAPEDPRFCDWRRRQITDFLRSSTTALTNINPKLVVSASVFSNYKDSRDYRMADWVEWNKAGLLHACVPMDFSLDNHLVFNPRADFASTNQGKATIWIGQGAYMNSPENTVKQLAYCRSKGFAGTVLYSYRNFSSDSTPTSRKEHANEMFKGKKTITVDNTQATINGPWKTGAFGKMHRNDYLFIQGGAGSNSVVFKAKLPKSGEYDVFEWHVAGTNRSANVSFRIETESGVENIEVNQQIKGSTWLWLGRFKFGGGSALISVTDANKDPEKVVIADAIRCVLVGTGAPATEPEPEIVYLRKKQLETFSYLKKLHQPGGVPTGLR